MTPPGFVAPPDPPEVIAAHRAAWRKALAKGRPTSPPAHLPLPATTFAAARLVKALAALGSGLLEEHRARQGRPGALPDQVVARLAEMEEQMKAIRAGGAR
jgi:hypothetical protein